MTINPTNKRNSRFFFSTLLLAFVAGLDAINVNCEYKVTTIETFGPLNKPYQCAAKDLDVEGHATVDKVAGTHVAAKTDDDVKLISMKKIKCERIPKDFNKHFKNLEGIFAFSMGLKTVVKDDLVGYNKLKYLDMSHNHIQTLPSNLFEGNPDLEWIDFADNKLYQVGKNLLTPLTKLNYADFQSNRCVDFRAWDKGNLRELSLALRNVKCKLNDV